ncbi:MAG: YeeE/YedE family protein [Rhodothermales bacterium]
MLEFISQPWAWYVAGPLIGLMVPALYIFSGKAFGISSSLRHACAAILPGKLEYLNYNWRKKGLWNLIFALGIGIGGYIAATLLANPDPIALSEATKADLGMLGVTDFNGLVPAEIFNWSNAGSFSGFMIIVFGGFLVGFGARYAGGCTSGHAISGMSNFQKASLFATIAFFIGGLLVTHFLYPILL